MKKEMMLGNEAVVRGAMEAGVEFATTFPGTPASEVGDLLAKFSKKYKLYSEYSTNEKIALESAAGAAFSGLKSMVSMKHYGLNVATDGLYPLIYLNCPLVIYVCDDPGCWSSVQAEQDTRWASRHGKIPTLEPADSQEAKDMTIKAFALAQKYSTPIIIRGTTRMAYSRTMVKLGTIIDSKPKGTFVKQDFKLGSQNTIDNHNNVLQKMEKIRKEIERSKLNIEEPGKGDIAIITSGVSYNYIKESFKDLDIKMPLLKLGCSYPFPKERVKKFLEGKMGVLIIEELDPIIENEVKQLSLNIPIHGKDLLPETGELKPEHILIALHKLFKKDIPPALTKKIEHVEPRLPTFCAGCPHRSTFYGVREAVGNKVIFGNDIGCYMLGTYPPYGMSDFITCMGGGAGISHGISKATGKKPVIFIGESTFLHAGIPALINMAYNKSDVLLIILDNSVTAMTGQQPNPGTGLDAKGEKTIEINFEKMAKACGADFVKKTNAFNNAKVIQDTKKLYNKKGVCVLISEGECRLNYVRKMARAGKTYPKFEFTGQDSSLNILKKFDCPAIMKVGLNWTIDDSLCWGCSVCKQLAPDYIQIKKK